MANKILVTGGTGYIGSHTVLTLLQAGEGVVVVDNLVNSSIKSLRRVEEITGKKVNFRFGDICDELFLKNLFLEFSFQSVVHFAGLKAVGESSIDPLSYYATNVGGTINLCRAMANAGVYELIFSSSATVYGEPSEMPIKESYPLGEPTNPYGQSKKMAEQLLKDLSASDPRWSIGLLRYFNPVGAHPSGLIGEDPMDTPNNLVPYISQVASGQLEYLSIFGDDYPTPDGTGVRDYIHVMDLAIGHLKALAFVGNRPGLVTWNLGTGQGYSVFEMVKAFETASGKNIPFRIKPRRSGDVAQCWSDPAKAAIELDWRAALSLDDMMRDAWHWQSKNPSGYRSELGG